MFVIYCALFFGAIIAVIYAYFKHSYTYWARKGVPFIEPSFPFGNNDFTSSKGFAYGIETWNWYHELKRKGHKLGGAWNFAEPVLVLTDPDYIKDVLQKDFQYFVDRDFFFHPTKDSMNKSLFVLEKEEWKNIRQKLTPTFTSAKMKMMFNSIIKCSEPLIESFKGAANTDDDIDLKDNLASFTVDVIGCIAFGLDHDSFQNSNSEFRKMALEFDDLGFIDSFKIIITRLSKKLALKLGITNNIEHVTVFFADLIRNNIEYRKKNNIKRPDFTQLLMDLQEATKNESNSFTFDEVVANLILFYFAGFDTSSSTMTYALFELAKNPEVQEKTRNEINSVLERHNGQLTYEAYQEMTYLRQVIDEAHRLYSPVHTLTRIANKPYKFKGSNFTLEKGTSVIISVTGLGRDPEYFPYPEKFDPDRFSTENKADRHSCVHIPFGEGPRICIGMRFGLMQSSIGLIRILQKFRISISPSTKLPLTFKEGSFTVKTNETLYVKAEEIK